MQGGKEMETLDRERCLELLDEHPSKVGRIALAGPRPSIFPVNYVVDAGDVVFRTDPGAKLGAAIHKAFVAFEVDDVEPEWRTGWSVLVRGQCHVVDDPQEVERLRDLPLVPWAAGEKADYVRITGDLISGRRLQHL
jgi:nitroimidazol reductase NimA-like FMN-containing flavoprotein (pyridoxamine 5'-phosphate oxidase superfamily)